MKLHEGWGTLDGGRMKTKKMGWPPAVGSFAAVGEMANDWNTGMEESPECQ
jgi:hypothetical protein